MINRSRFLRWTVKNYSDQHVNDNIKCRNLVTDGERAGGRDHSGAVRNCPPQNALARG